MIAKPREQLVAEWAGRLKRLGLTSTVQILWPLIRPMGALIGPILWLGQPVVSGLADETMVGELALLLEDAQAMDQLEQQLVSVDVAPDR